MRAYMYTHLGWAVANILVRSLEFASDINSCGAQVKENCIYEFERNLSNFTVIDPDITDLVYNRVRRYYRYICEGDPHEAILGDIEAAGALKSIPEYTLGEYEAVYKKSSGGSLNWNDIAKAYAIADPKHTQKAQQIEALVKKMLS